MTELIDRTLGHYRVTAMLGKGGMGEVFRAVDERLEREVAIKVLPDRLADDTERLARFEREAKLLASLNHPHIATLHGLEEHEGRRFLVMELAEGESLAARIAKGRVPIDDALEIARQIAEGLEAAHAQGIIHRDLKPANVMVSEAGAVKVLDFGLAKAFDPEASGEQSAESLTHSPTISADMTRPGIVLGTAAYMSPEQARGKAIDTRTDIWSFGCVLYEMLTGKRPFDGDTSTETMAAILKEEPEWSVLPDGTPRAARLLLRRCLRKDPSQRLQHIGDARIELADAGADPDEPRAVPAPRGLRRLAVLGWTLALALGLVAFWAILRSAPEQPRPVVRARLHVPEGEEVQGSIALSPDGSRLVYMGPGETGFQLWLRSLDEEHGAPIPGTEEAAWPVFSPDGLLVAFRSRDGELGVASTSGSAPMILVDEVGSAFADWGPDGLLYFITKEGGIGRVSASGGDVEVVTEADAELDLRFSLDVLPHGRAALVTIRRGRWEDVEFGLLDLETGAARTLAPGRAPQYLDSGHLLYGLPGRQLLAAPFDSRKMRLTGPAAVVAESVYEFSISTNGTLVHLLPWEIRSRPVWTDRAGTVEPVVAGWEGEFYWPDLSPDGQRISLAVDGPDGRNLWVRDLPDGVPRQLTFETRTSMAAVWTRDGQSLTYWQSGTGLMEKHADGQGQATVLVAVDNRVTVSPTWTRDRAWLVYQAGGLGNQPADIFAFQPQAADSPAPLLATEYDEACPVLSPDERWMAYNSTRSGRTEVYVRPFPDVHAGQWKVSSSGGGMPMWAHSGHELFYINDDRELVAVQLRTEPTFRVLSERPLFSITEFHHFPGAYSYRGYAVAPDDQRFLMLKQVEGLRREVMLTFNFFEELKRLVPVE